MRILKFNKKLREPERKKIGIKWTENLKRNSKLMKYWENMMAWCYNCCLSGDKSIIYIKYCKICYDKQTYRNSQKPI